MTLFITTFKNVLLYKMISCVFLKQKSDFRKKYTSAQSDSLCVSETKSVLLHKVIRCVFLKEK